MGMKTSSAKQNANEVTSFDLLSILASLPQYLWYLACHRPMRGDPPIYPLAHPGDPGQPKQGRLPEGGRQPLGGGGPPGARAASPSAIDPTSCQGKARRSPGGGGGPREGRRQEACVRGVHAVAGTGLRGPLLSPTDW